MQFSIRHKLLLIILVVLIPFIGISIHHYYQMVEQNRKSSLSRNQAIAEQISARLESMIEQSLAVLRVLSSHPAVIARDPVATDRLFAGILPSFPNHLNIIAADMAGNNVGSAVQVPGVRKINYRDEEWFQQARAGAPAVSDRHISRIFKIPVVRIAMPVKTAGKQVAVLSMPLDLLKVRSGFELAEPLPPGFTANIVDSAGNVLVCVCEDESPHPHAPGELCETVELSAAPGTGLVQGVDSDGIERYYSIAPVRNTGWKVVIGEPTALAYEKASAAARGYLVVIIGISLTALVLSLLMSRTITRKIASVINALREVEKGNLAVQVPVTGHDELTGVADRFNHMARERSEAEEASARATAFLTSVLEGIGEGVIVVNRDFRILSANGGYCRQLKLSVESVIGRTCHELSHHSETPCSGEAEGGCVCAVRKCFDTGEEHRAVHRHFDEAGKPIFVETRAYPLRDASGAVTAAIETLTDVTDRRQLEAQLFHSQKMEAIGLLAGGVAHDFNNILTAIIGYSTLLTMSMEDGDRRRSYVHEIDAAAQRAAGLTKGLLAFSRKQFLEPAPVRLNGIVGGVQGMLGRIIGEDVELHIELEAQERSVQADAGQIDQVLMNLCTNARDAMPQGGRLTIATRLVQFDGAVVKGHSSLRSGAYMVLSVTDTGKGMDEKIKEKIFEPFFTTKEVGRGTGLGLSIVYGIVEQHHGAVEVISDPGQGTTFLVYLPVIEQDFVAAGAPAAETASGGSEVILLAEDDAVLLDLAGKVLESHGYRVIPARDGVDAVEKFREHGDRVDLLILDVLMPRMNGKEAFDQIRKHRQDIRTLFMSGYASDLIREKGVDGDAFEFIRKPFSPVAFLQKVRTTLSNDACDGLPANTN